MTPLWTALQTEQYDIASVLVKHGVDTDCWSSTTGGCLETLLHRAIDERRESAAIFLIRSHANIDSPRRMGPNGEGEFIKMCVNFYFLFDLYVFPLTSGRDEVIENSSPLHLACQNGLVRVLKALIDHGVYGIVSSQ